MIGKIRLIDCQRIWQNINHRVLPAEKEASREPIIKGLGSHFGYSNTGSPSGTWETTGAY
jgi:hypothetical protein